MDFPHSDFDEIQIVGSYGPYEAPIPRRDRRNVRSLKYRNDQFWAFSCRVEKAIYENAQN